MVFLKSLSSNCVLSVGWHILSTVYWSHFVPFPVLCNYYHIPNTVYTRIEIDVNVIFFQYYIRKK